MANPRFQLPSMSVLSAFESAARHCNFSRAAEELRTSQPAVSRHISGLEGDLGTKLFERRRNKVDLTADGRRLYHAVVAGFQEIGRAVEELQRHPRRKVLTIACSYDVAHLWLMPRHGGLQEIVGADTDIRIVTSEYEHQAVVQDDTTDIALTYLNPLPQGLEAALLLEEEVFPVCSPDVARSIGMQGRSALPKAPLLHLSKQNFGWASWQSWLATYETVLSEPGNERRFSSYVYLLEAAADGAGVALGWSGLVDRYLEQGRLVRPCSDSLKTGGGFRAIINRRTANVGVIDDVVAYLRNI